MIAAVLLVDGTFTLASGCARKLSLVSSYPLVDFSGAFRQSSTYAERMPAPETVRCAVARLYRLRRAVEIWLADAGIGGNVKSSSLRGFDAGPMLEFADRENLLGNAIVFTPTSVATC